MLHFAGSPVLEFALNWRFRGEPEGTFPALISCRNVVNGWPSDTAICGSINHWCSSPPGSIR